MKALWSTYARWFETLTVWAALLVPEREARRCARRALAEMFVLALNAVETLDGPYMHSTDVLYRFVCMHRTDNDAGLLSWAYQSMPYPDEDFLEEIADLYAAVYEAGYIARLTLWERTEIAALIRLYDPTDMSSERLSVSLEENCPTTHPLRRVVGATRDKTRTSEHVQALALELAIGETQRARTWLKRQTIENGVS